MNGNVRSNPNATVKVSADINHENININSAVKISLLSIFLMNVNFTAKYKINESILFIYNGFHKTFQGLHHL